MSITRGQMRTKIQQRIGDTAATSAYATALYNDIIDSRVLARALEWQRLAPNYYLKHASYTGVDDATDITNEFYNLPQDFSAFVKLERQFGGQQQGGSSNKIVYQSIVKVNPEDQDRYRIGFNLVLLLPDSMQNFQQTVSLWDTKFRIIPTPENNSYLYRLRYLRQPIVASSDSYILDIPDALVEYIVLECAIFVLMTTGDPIMNDIRNQFVVEQSNVKNFFRRRDMGITGIGTLDHMSGGY